MKVIYEKTDSNNFGYKRWFDNNGDFDIWYKEAVMLYDYQTMDIPSELKVFLDKWNGKILEYKKTFIERYPVKLAHIEFIYDYVVYALYPRNVSATYKTRFMFLEVEEGEEDEEFEVSWDALFEEYQREIRDDLEKELGVKHSRYWGMLD